MLRGVERGHVDVDEADARCTECGAGRGREIGVAGADPDHDVCLAGQRVGGGVAGRAHRADRRRMVIRKRALADVRLRHRDARRLGKRAKRVRRLRIDRAAATHDQRPPGTTDQLHGAGEHHALRGRPCNVPHAGRKELLGPVVGLRLDVLGQGDDRGARFGGVGEHPHRTEQRGRQLLRAPHTVEEPGHRPEGVVDRDVVRHRMFELLEHRVGDARGEQVARQEQHGQPVDRGRRGAGHHVGRARADRRQAGHRRQSVSLPREACRRVDHPLLIAALVVRHRAWVGQLLLEQRLPQARDVAMPEDAEHALDQPVLHAVTLASLRNEEADDRLSHSQTHGAHRVLPSAARGGRQPRVDGLTRPGRRAPTRGPDRR